jgi:hypothetical protein
MADPKAPECGCKQPDCFACEITSLRAWLLQHGLHIVSEADRKVLALASDVAANFGQPRSAELEIAFMKAVNDMLRCAP